MSLPKPVALLTSNELQKWRNGPLAKMASSRSIAFEVVYARAPELAARHKSAFRTGARGRLVLRFANAQEQRKVILSDAEVRAFVKHPFVSSLRERFHRSDLTLLSPSPNLGAPARIASAT